MRHAVEAALAAGLASVTVVTGHEEGAVRAALAGLDVTFVHNPDHAEGLSTSMRTGIAALPAETDAAIILLGDMPGITPAAIARLAGAFDPAAGALVVVPTFEGKRGNPVVWSARYFPELLAVHGDTGGPGQARLTGTGRVRQSPRICAIPRAACGRPPWKRRSPTS
mgnify:CR=1 FL=1